MEDIIQRFYSDLVDVLPMNDAGFRAKLFSAGLLSGNLKSQIKSLPTSADKAECFLDDGINNDSTSFQKLVAVMERYSIENVKKLANHIKRVIQTHQSVSGKNVHTSYSNCMIAFTGMYKKCIKFSLRYVVAGWLIIEYIF